MDIFYTLLGHIAFLLVAASLLLKDILLLRTVSIIASLFSIAYQLTIPIEPLWLIINWNIVFIAINIFRIGILIKERYSVHFSEEEKELYETQFKNFSPVEFMKMLRIATWKEIKKGSHLTEEGKKHAQLMLLYNGKAKVLHDDKNITELKDGDFVGEMTFSSEAPATATVVAQTTIKLLIWNRQCLKKLLIRNPSMHFAMQSILSENLVAKLTRY